MRGGFWGLYAVLLGAWLHTGSLGRIMRPVYWVGGPAVFCPSIAHLLALGVQILAPIRVTPSGVGT